MNPLKKFFQKFMMNCPTITVEKLSDAFNAYYLIDVREDWERQMGTIENALHLPMNMVRGRLDALPKNKPLVVFCRSGKRSEHVTKYLRTHGFEAYNLIGGILAWAAYADPSITTY